jgi:hypothetical protein
VTQHHQIKWAVRFDASGYRRPWRGLNWKQEPLIVSCQHDHGDATLCPPCVVELRDVLSDIPALLHDLDVAIVRDARFVQHGSQRGKVRQPTDKRRQDEARLDFNDTASNTKRRLTNVLQAAVDQGMAPPSTPADVARHIHAHLGKLAKWEQAADLARDITAAVARAHKVIDAPPSLWYYGPCPDCGHDIYQERITVHDRTSHVTCPQPECTYSEKPQDHNRRQLDAGEDRMLTVGELVSAITSAGEPVTRGQINGWIRRDGLPREERSLTQWVDGRLVSRPVWVYRLGDVRRLALEAEARNQRRTA